MAEAVRASPVPGVHLRTARVNGITVRFADAGVASNPLVVFCHGWPESWYSWRKQLTAVAAAGFYGVAPDMRGYGGTDAPHDPEEYDHFKHVSGDILGLMEHTEHATAVIVGHDWGAAFAWNLASMRPDKFTRVCAMSVPRALRRGSGGGFTVTSLKKQFGWPEGAPRAKGFFYMLYHNEMDGRTGNLVAAQDYARDPRRFFSSIMGTTAPPDWIKKHTNPPKVGPMDPREKGGFMDRMRTLKDPKVLAPWFTEDDLDYYVNEYRTSGFFGGLNWYRSLDFTARSGMPYSDKPIAQPALFIGGTRDMVTTMFGGVDHVNEALAAAAPRCDVLWLECGHWIQNEMPREVNAALVGFLTGQPSKL